jgi:hypothetical protein
MLQRTAPPEPQSGAAPVYNLAAHRARRVRRVAHPLVEMKGVIDDMLLGRVSESVAVARLGDLWNEAKSLLPEWDSTLFTNCMDAPA